MAYPINYSHRGIGLCGINLRMHLIVIRINIPRISLYSSCYTRILLVVLSYSYFARNASTYAMYAGLLLHGIAMVILAKELVKKFSKILTFFRFYYYLPFSLLGIVILGGMVNLDH